MKKLTFVLLSAALLAFVASCKKINGEGPIITENRPTGNFTGVASSISASVVYQQAPVLKVEITAQRNILDVIETFVVDDELVIKFKNNVQVKNHESIAIQVSSPVITSLRMSGSGSIVAPDSINTTRMNLGISGSGNINLHKIVSPAVGANISGSGNISIFSGASTTGNLKISGSGNINMMNVPVASVTTITSGSGEIRVHASQSLDVTISGSGSVYYTGNPIVDTHISGSGRVIHQ